MREKLSIDKDVEKMCFGPLFKDFGPIFKDFGPMFKDFGTWFGTFLAYTSGIVGVLLIALGKCMMDEQDAFDKKGIFNEKCKFVFDEKYKSMFNEKINPILDEKSPLLLDYSIDIDCYRYEKLLYGYIIISILILFCFAKYLVKCLWSMFSGLIKLISCAAMIAFFIMSFTLCA